MIACPSCGEKNPEKYRHCGFCGAPLRASPAPRETRKTVTILFSDVTGSTALGERLDPESLRALMARYFAAMRAVIQAHGGTVEKFIGDAVMAVFGIPIVHEDDALRAVRAAAEIRGVIAELNIELRQERGLELMFRTGVTTGEVVAGDPARGETLVTGDTVNTAARLEQAARPGDILIGATTLRLVRDAVIVERVAPVVAKGKLVPGDAYRLVDVRSQVAGRSRHLEAPMVGRDGELSRLLRAFDQTVQDRSPQLFTLLGAAGVGKSRLVAEFLDSIVSAALVLRGRCLPYGEGITYWPLRDVVHAAAGIAEEDSREVAREKLSRSMGGDRDREVVTSSLASAIGLSDAAAGQREIFWAARRLLEHVARDRPVVVVWEDIHWAEQTFLDLIEDIADLSRDAPLLVLCPARPELLDKRLGWGGGKLNSTTVLLEPLSSSVIGRLLDALPGGIAVPPALGGRIIAAAEGNPLYLEEMLAMLVDDDLLALQDGRWIFAGQLDQVHVPPTVQALLAARLDQLDPNERVIAERASVVGRVFEESAVEELTPADTRAEVSRALVALVRKELVRPDRSELTTGDAFKFRHILIRDAAYDGLPKRERADLHETFATWLERVSGDRASEYEEIVGYHLEQAHRYRSELGQTEDLDGLASRASDRFRSAAKRAVDRGDLRTADGLLERARALAASDRTRATQLQVDQADLLERLGRFREAGALADAARTAAHEIGDDRLSARARLVAAQVLADIDPEGGLGIFLAESEAALPILEGAGDHEGVARALGALGMLSWAQGRLDPVDLMYERVIEQLELSGHTERIPRIKGIMAMTTAQGRTDVATAMRRIEQLEREVEGDRQGTSFVLCSLAGIQAMAGRDADARSSAERAIELAESLGLDFDALSMAADLGFVHLVGGRPAAAEEAMRPAFERMLAIEATALAGTVAALLADAISQQGRQEEALGISKIAEQRLQPDDVSGQALWRSARARALAASGRGAEAVELARQAVDLLSPTDFLNQLADAQVVLAEALSASEDRAGARETLARAHEAYVRKGNVVMMDKVGRLLGPDSPPPDRADQGKRGT
ncbi:MAG: adenylate/guanylate cyclase domain-containing protein [Chloroflexota bacterium]